MQRTRTRWRRAALTAAALRRRMSEVGGDRGSSSVEFAILLPILAVLIFGGPQLAMWYVAREAALAAAQAGARTASANGASSGAGVAAADSYLATTASGTITSSSAIETDTAATVSVRVQATVVGVIPLPGLTFSVDVTSTRAREIFTNPGTP